MDAQVRPKSVVENRRLKILKISAAVVLALVLAAGLLVWFLPARLAMLWITPPHNLRLQQVSGLLWDGRGQVTTASGHPLGQAHWLASRSAIWGKPELQLDFTGPQLDFSGHMQKLPAGQIDWRDVHVRADLALLDAYAALPVGQPRGELSVAASHVLLEGGWPLQMRATAQWTAASMHRSRGDLPLGTLNVQAQAINGVIAAQLSDDGRGPLEAAGTLQLSPLGWRVDATLRSRQTEPALSHWLAGLGLGRPDASGTFHIQRSGGLAIGLPAAPVSRTP